MDFVVQDVGEYDLIVYSATSGVQNVPISQYRNAPGRLTVKPGPVSS